METPTCALFLCCNPAARVRVRPPAREFLEYLCEYHWRRLQTHNAEQSASYEPLDTPCGCAPPLSVGTLPAAV